MKLCRSRYRRSRTDRGDCQSAGRFEAWKEGDRYRRGRRRPGRYSHRVLSRWRDCRNQHFVTGTVPSEHPPTEFRRAYLAGLRLRCGGQYQCIEHRDRLSLITTERRLIKGSVTMVADSFFYREGPTRGWSPLNKHSPFRSSDHQISDLAHVFHGELYALPTQAAVLHAAVRHVVHPP